MKSKLIPVLAACVLSSLTAFPATNDLAAILQKGLFEEEANHNLNAAIQAYKSVVVQFDYERKMTATAVFRLGECYRKQGNLTAANAQYERILREFADQPALVAASRNYVQSAPAGNGLVPRSASSGPIALWHAEGNMVDAIGERIGVPSGGVTYAPGQIGRAFSFDGTSGGIVAPDSPELNFGPDQDFSIELWVRPQINNNSYGVMSVVDKRYAPNLTQCLGYEIALDDGRLAARISASIADNGLLAGPVGPDLRDGRFHHVALTVARTARAGGHLYVDGAPVLTFDPTSQSGDLSNDQPFRIGCHASSFFNGFFRGQIDELAIYKRALSASEIKNIFLTEGSVVGQSLEKGPIALWHADGNAVDSAGNHDASSKKEVEFAKGVFGQAFRFNGDGASVNIPPSPGLDPENQVTIEFWMKADPDNKMQSYQGLVTSEFYGVSIANGYSSETGVLFYINTDGRATPSPSLWPNTADANGGGAPVSPGQWHHIAGTYDGTKLQLYVDGRPCGRPLYHTGLIAPMVKGNFISIGSEEGRTLEPSITHNRYFKGLIDEAAIYNRALSAEEIMQDYRAGKDALDGLNAQTPAKPGLDGLNAPASSGPISFGGVKWMPWHTLFAVQGDKLISLPKPRPGFNYGHSGDGRGAVIVANVGDSDWRDYSLEFEYCVTGIDPSFNPYGIGSDYHDGRIHFHLAEAHESWNQRGGSGYNIGIHGNGTWDLSCCYNNYCPAPVGYANPVKDGERQLAQGKGLKIDREFGNKFRIDLLGQRIRIWVDGEKIVDLVDDKMDDLIGGQRLDHGGVGFEWGLEAMGWVRNFSRRDL